MAKTPEDVMAALVRRGRVGDHDQAMSIVGVWPACDQRQTLVRRRLDPQRISAVDLDQIAGLEIHQIAEDLTGDIVMSIEHRVAGPARRRGRF